MTFGIESAAARGRTAIRVLIALALAAWGMSVAADSAAAWEPGPASYGIGSSKNVPITMDDGTVLRADVFFPTDASGQPAAGPFPVVLSETPYGKWFSTQSAGGGLDGAGLTGYQPYLIQRGYIGVVVDVRGTGASDGQFQFFSPRETADTVKVVDWASQLPNSNGNVGMTGPSYLGIVQLLAAAQVGPNSPLKAIFPIVAANDPYREVATSGGLINLESDLPLLGLYNVTANGGQVAEALFNPALLSDPTLVARILDHVNGGLAVSSGLTQDFLADGDKAYDQDWWQERSPGNGLQRIVDNGVAAYLVGTLWDVFQSGEPLNYAGLQNAWAGRPVTAPMSPDQPVTGRYQLQERNVYHSNFFEGEPDLAPIQLAWFDRWLKGEQTGIDETDTPLHLVDHLGRRFEASHYPLPEAAPTTYYLGGGSKLATEKPTAAGEDPIVFTGASLFCDRATEQWSLGAIQLAFESLGLSDACADHDIVPQSAGPAQLTYTTDPFDSRTVIAGPIDLTLFATSTRPDTEWVAKLSDVAPDGTSTDLTQGALLGSKRALDEDRTWRSPDGDPQMPWHPFTRAARQAVTPGEVTRYDVEVRPTFATLDPGHRLKLTILTGQTPHLVPFPIDIPNLLGGVYGVQRTAEAASFLELPLISSAPASSAPQGGAAGGAAAAAASLKPHAAKRCARKRGKARRRCLRKP